MFPKGSIDTLFLILLAAACSLLFTGADAKAIPQNEGALSSPSSVTSQTPAINYDDLFIRADGAGGSGNKSGVGSKKECKKGTKST